MGRGRHQKGMKVVRGWATGTTSQLPLGRLVLCLDGETGFEVGSDPCLA